MSSIERLLYLVYLVFKISGANGKIQEISIVEFEIYIIATVK